MTALSFARRELARLLWKARAEKEHDDASLKVVDKFEMVCRAHHIELGKHTARFRAYCQNKIQQRASKYGN
jgi:hypothetical protein